MGWFRFIRVRNVGRRRNWINLVLFSCRDCIVLSRRGVLKLRSLPDIGIKIRGNLRGLEILQGIMAGDTKIAGHLNFRKVGVRNCTKLVRRLYPNRVTQAAKKHCSINRFIPVLTIPTRNWHITVSPAIDPFAQNAQSTVFIEITRCRPQERQ